MSDWLQLRHFDASLLVNLLKIQRLRLLHGDSCDHRDLFLNRVRFKNYQRAAGAPENEVALGFRLGD